MADTIATAVIRFVIYFVTGLIVGCSLLAIYGILRWAWDVLTDVVHGVEW
jgi:hypothetical protein